MEWAVEEGGAMVSVVVPDVVLEAIVVIVGGTGAAIDPYRDSTLSPGSLPPVLTALEAAVTARRVEVDRTTLAALALPEPTPWAAPRLEAARDADPLLATAERLDALCRLALDVGAPVLVRGR